jgi:hypothetical protein
MTIIAAVLCESNVLVASDSLGVNFAADAKEEQIKLWRIHDMPLVWGFMGHGPIGEAAKAEIDRHFDSPQSRSRLRWDTFAAFMGEAVAKANGDAKRRAELAGEELPPTYRIALLAAGYIRREAKILGVDPGGDPVLRDDFIFLCENTPYAVAMAVWETLRRERGDALVIDAALLRTVFEIITAVTASTGGPIQMWDLTMTSAERIQ